MAVREVSMRSMKHRDGPGQGGGKKRQGGGGGLHSSVNEVFRDKAIWVLDKPSGVLTHPNQPAKKSSNTLLKGEFDYTEECYHLKEPGAPERVWLVHRLDQDTSGLIICAFDPEAAAILK